MNADWQNAGFGIYIHWPFCEAKCPYCDFNSHVTRQIDHDRWARAYLREIDRAAQEIPDRIVNTVFFGGGTPSLMKPETVKAILDRIRLHWPMSNDPEITLEANPSSVEAGKFKAFSEAGITRISMGIQALNDRDLQRLGRVHSVAEGRRAFDIARDTFERVSFDLIYARQDQTPQEWRTELKDALGMAVDHVSLYQLTIEDGTTFGDRYARGGLKGLPVEDSAADMFEITQEVCSSLGFDAYEVSNHANLGSESRHNLIYWRYGDYLGIGPGAHGRLTLNGEKFATETRLMPTGWLESTEQGSGEKQRTRLSPIEQGNEYLLMGLRLTEGIDLKRLNQISGQSISAENLDHLQELGLIVQTGDTLKATQAGRMVLNGVLAELAFSPD